MSLRSDPAIKPERPDPVTRNQPELEKIYTNERTRTKSIPGNYPQSSIDSTDSGGYGARPEEVWSNKAQRGIDMPISQSAETYEKEMKRVHDDAGLIDQTADGMNSKNELQDAKQGRDARLLENDDEWGVENGANRDF